MLEAYRTWRLLGVLPGGSASIENAPAYVLEAFRALAEVERELDERDESEQRTTQAEQIAAFMNGAKRR